MSQAEGRRQVHVGAGGWLQVRVADNDEWTGGVQAYVRFDLADDGRLHPAQLFAYAQEGEYIRSLRGADLRGFPLAAVEGDANGRLREEIMERLDQKLELRFVPPGSKSERQGSSTPDGVSSGTWPPTTGTHPKGRARVPTIEVPTTRPYPDEFYATIGAAYQQAAESSRNPAVKVGEAAGAPVKTVHRWVAEARKRGHLPPARPGKAL